MVSVDLAPPRFEFKPKNLSNGPAPGFEYGPEGYDPNKCNVGFDQKNGKFQIEIKGLVTPKSKEGQRVCREDLNEVIAASYKTRRRSSVACSTRKRRRRS